MNLESYIKFRKVHTLISVSVDMSMLRHLVFKASCLFGVLDYLPVDTINDSDHTHFSLP